MARLPILQTGLLLEEGEAFIGEGVELYRSSARPCCHTKERPKCLQNKPAAQQSSRRCFVPSTKRPTRSRRYSLIRSRLFWSSNLKDRRRGLHSVPSRSHC